MRKAWVEYAESVGRLFPNVPTLLEPPPHSFASFNALNGGVFSDGQRVVTGMPFTHSAAIIRIHGMTVVWGADLTVDMQAWEKLSSEDYIIFTPVPGVFTPEQLDVAFCNAFRKYGGEGYGIREVPYFLWSGFCSQALRIDTRRWHNCFPGKVICSQLQWYHAWELAQFRGEMFNALNLYRPSSIHSGYFFEMMVKMVNMKLFYVSSKKWSF